jgi:AcrR family transcriptional regulator
MRGPAAHRARQLVVSAVRVSSGLASLASSAGGWGGPPGQQVSSLQRARIMAAAVDAVAEVGYQGMTVAAVIQRARISRKTFYEAFANRDACFVAIVDQIFARAHSVVGAAYAAESNWLAATRAAMHSLLGLIDEEPRLARIWFVDAMAGSEAVQARRAQAAALLAAAVDGGRELAGERRQPSPLSAEAAVGGIEHIIYTRLANGHYDPCVELLGPCMHVIVLPYLGAARAMAELRRKPPAPGSRRRAAEARPPRRSLRELNQRVTNPTIKVLEVICARPGLSNRTIADESGIVDQGQMSKLLSRLERLELIENRGLGQVHGAANSWHVTAHGLELQRATNVKDFMGVNGTAPPAKQARGASR